MLKSIKNKASKLLLGAGLVAGSMFGFNQEAGGLEKMLSDVRSYSYKIDTTLDGVAFSSINADDFDVQDTYSGGIRLNTNLDGQSPTATYSFLLPPSSSGTYQNLKLSIKGKGGWISGPHIYVKGQEYTQLNNDEGTYELNLYPPGNYINQYGNYAELNVGVQSAHLNEYELDYIRVQSSINTQNTLLDKFVINHSSAKALEEYASLMQEFQYQKIMNQQIAKFVNQYVSAIQNISSIVEIEELDFSSISKMNGFVESVYGMMDAFSCATSIAGGVLKNWHGETPEELSDRLQNLSFSLKNLSDSCIEYGNNGSLTTSEKTQLRNKISNLSSDLNTCIKRLSYEDKTLDTGFAYAMSQIYHCTDLFGNPPGECAKNYAKSGYESSRVLLWWNQDIEDLDCNYAVSFNQDKSFLCNLRDYLEDFSDELIVSEPTSTPRPTNTPLPSDKYDFSDASFCRDVEIDSPYEPINRISSYNKLEDNRIKFWWKLENTYANKDYDPWIEVKADFHKPDGSFYVTTNWVLDDDPRDEGENYWEWYKGWTNDLSNAMKFHDYPGKWQCKLYVKPEQDWILEEVVNLNVENIYTPTFTPRPTSTPRPANTLTKTPTKTPTTTKTNTPTLKPTSTPTPTIFTGKPKISVDLDRFSPGIQSYLDVYPGDYVFGSLVVDDLYIPRCEGYGGYEVTIGIDPIDLVNNPITHSPDIDVARGDLESTENAFYTSYLIEGNFYLFGINSNSNIINDFPSELYIFNMGIGDNADGGYNFHIFDYMEEVPVGVNSLQIKRPDTDRFYPFFFNENNFIMNDAIVNVIGHTPTATRTLTPKPSHTPTKIPTKTPTTTFTSLPTNTKIDTPTPSFTPLPTNTHTPTVIPTFTPSWTNTQIPTFTNSPTNTSFPTPTFSFTPLPTDTNSPLPTNTPSFTYTPSPTPTSNLDQKVLDLFSFSKNWQTSNGNETDYNHESLLGLIEKWKYGD